MTVNGRRAELGDRADPARDLVCLDGRRLAPEPLQYWLVNKPRGVVTTLRDPQGRPDIRGLVPDSRARLFPVGRLDRETEGLVLLTNDGPLHHALLHPSHQVEREYRVRVRGRVREETLRALEAGVKLDGERTAPARCERVARGADTTRFHLVLIEGRKRQIRRSLAALGHPVTSLRRVRMGSLRLGRLPSGGARPLREGERRALLRDAGLVAAGPGSGRNSERKPGRRTGSKPRARRAKGRASNHP